MAATSYAIVDGSLPGGVADLLRQQVPLRRQNPVVFFNDQTLTYEELGTRARAVSIALFEAGIRSGDKVGILFPNHPDFIASFFGASGIGATVVPINPFLKADEIEHILLDSNARAIIVHERLMQELLPALEKVVSCQNVFVFSYQKQFLPDQAPAIAGSNRARYSIMLLNDAELERRNKTGMPVALEMADKGAKVSGDSLAVLVYTSGTTGKPKGAMLSHANLIAAVNMKRHRIHFSSDDRVIAVLPLCHIYGLAVVMLGMIAEGGAIIVLEKFEPKAALEAIQNKRATILPAVPAMYQFMTMELEKQAYDLSSLRYGICGAAPIDVELLARLDALFGAPILEGYALTETACIGTITPLEGPRKIGSAGPRIPGVELSIFDGDLNKLPPGKEHIGQIAIKGPNVMQGYYNQSQATAEVLKDGWFLTGDLGYLDEDGYLYISGRTKEMIIRGGQNIYPREVESVIAAMDEVAECAVVGVPDQYMGERVKAVLVVKPGCSLDEERVKEYCSQRLAAYKVPRIVEFRNELPRNSTGKLLKRLLI